MLFDLFRNSRCETIFTSETVDMTPKQNARPETVALRLFCGLYLSILF